MEVPLKKPFTSLESGILKIGFHFYWVYSAKTTMIPFFICCVLPELDGFKRDIELRLGLKA